MYDWYLVCRLMMVLALLDTVFLLSSLLTFSAPHLSHSYANTAWYHLVPYSLPIAQVSKGPLSFSTRNLFMMMMMMMMMMIIDICLDVSNRKCLHDDFTGPGEICFNHPPSLQVPTQVRLR